MKLIASKTYDMIWSFRQQNMLLLHNPRLID